MLSNIWQHPKTTLWGILIGVTTIVGVLTQQGITLGHAGTGTVVALIGGLAAGFLGLLSKDPSTPNSSSTTGSGSGAVKVGALLLLCVAVFTLAGCPSTTAVSKCSHAAADIGAGLQTAASVNHQMLQAGEESQQEAATVATYIDQAAKANDAFAHTLQALPSSGTEISDAQAIAAFQTMATEITTLDQEGILHLKSPKAQTAFSTVMVSIQGGIATIQAVIAFTQPTAPASSAPANAASSNHRPRAPTRWPATLPLFALVLSPVEIEELISLAIAAGSSLVTKLESLRGESDPQLLSSALASDAAAEQQAEADGATS